MVDKTSAIEEIAINSKRIGDDLNKRYEKSGSIIEAICAVSAYKASISAAKAKLKYDIEHREKIDFYESPKR